MIEERQQNRQFFQTHVIDFHRGQFVLLCYINVTGFWKTDHIVTIDIARNTDLKY